VHPEDFQALLDDERACLGVAPPNTSDAVLTTVEPRAGVRSATAFSRQGEGLEWTGLLRFPGAAIEEANARQGARGHVYELLTPHLPIAVRDVRAREIDTPADYDRALEWVAPIAHHWA